MTIKELIEFLQDYNPDMIVETSWVSGFDFGEDVLEKSNIKIEDGKLVIYCG